VTLAFTDIEGSSELSERHGAAFEPLRQAQFRLLREAAARHQGL
jgi:class 3 adenylate cyclase